MSIWGKIVGGGIGFAIGGPLGALLGGLAGHAYDKASGDGVEGTRQVAFTIAVIVLGAKMAKADGKVTKNEVDAFKAVFQVPPHEVENVSRVFNMARKDAKGFEPYARQMSRLFRDNPAVLEDLLDGLFHIAKADGIVHPAELKYLKSVAAIFGFSEGEFARIRASHVGADASDPYTILGLDHDVTDRELKAAYRKLVREHHPDTLIAQGMPEEFIQVANDKLATINVAYDSIAGQRGLN